MTDEQRWARIMRQGNDVYFAIWVVIATMTPMLALSASSAASPTQPSVRIPRFECVRQETLEGESNFPWQQGVSRWDSGGPDGAAWNATDLGCAVEVVSDCARGWMDTELRVNGALVGSKRTRISSAGPKIIRIDIEAPKWQKHLDQQSALTRRFPYRTASFNATAMVTCELPEAFGPGDSSRRAFAADAHFTAGFASGE